MAEQVLEAPQVVLIRRPAQAMTAIMPSALEGVAAAARGRQVAMEAPASAPAGSAATSQGKMASRVALLLEAPAVAAEARTAK